MVHGQLTGRTRGPCSPPSGFALPNVNSLSMRRNGCVLTGQLLREILVKLVAILVKTDEGSGFRITCVRSACRPRYYALVSKRTDVLYERASSVSRVYAR